MHELMIKMVNDKSCTSSAAYTLKAELDQRRRPTLRRSSNSELGAGLVCDRSEQVDKVSIWIPE